MHEDRNGKDRKNRIPVIGLTGGIGTGKSTVAEYLKKGNYAHVDADQIGRDLTADGSELLPVLDQVFRQESWENRENRFCGKMAHLIAKRWVPSLFRHRKRKKSWMRSC